MAVSAEFHEETHLISVAERVPIYFDVQDLCFI